MWNHLLCCNHHQWSSFYIHSFPDLTFSGNSGSQKMLPINELCKLCIFTVCHVFRLLLILSLKVLETMIIEIRFFRKQHWMQEEVRIVRCQNAKGQKNPPKKTQSARNTFIQIIMLAVRKWQLQVFKDHNEDASNVLNVIHKNYRNYEYTSWINNSKNKIPLNQINTYWGRSIWASYYGK